MRSIFLAVVITASVCWFLSWQLEKSMKGFLLHVPSKSIIIPD
jgi:hypothetical protein|tara:strand:+ start:347 stop:475 length:129 start_codon:yes stop_codon:yes gene_type:complete